MIDNFIDRLNSCIVFSENTEDTLKSLDKQIQDIQEKNNTLTLYIEDLNTALAYYKKSVDVIYDRTIHALESQLTELMQEVFSGCKYGIHFEIEDLRGIKNLIIELFDEKFQGVPDDLGGSLETVAGYLFHLMYLIKSGRPKILIMDELFRDVNNEYLFNLIELINRLAKATDSINILVTHVEEIECIAERIYNVHGGKYELYSG